MVDDNNHQDEENRIKIEYIKTISDCSAYDGTNAYIMNDDQKNRIRSCLEKALDIRKFEIEMYWKRAQYFWTFISLVYGGFAFSTLKFEQEYRWIAFILASVGVIFTSSWYLVNKASKFWQSNWERHVDFLEDIIHGPLYKAIFFKRGGILSPNDSYPSSVSRINQHLSAYVAIGSLMLFFEEYIHTLWILQSRSDIYYSIHGVLIITWGAVIGIIGFGLLLWIAMSEKVKWEEKMWRELIFVGSLVYLAMLYCQKHGVAFDGELLQGASILRNSVVYWCVLILILACLLLAISSVTKNRTSEWRKGAWKSLCWWGKWGIVIFILAFLLGMDASPIGDNRLLKFMTRDLFLVTITFLTTIVSLAMLYCKTMSGLGRGFAEKYKAMKDNRYEKDLFWRDQDRLKENVVLKRAIKYNVVQKVLDQIEEKIREINASDNMNFIRNDLEEEIKNKILLLDEIATKDNLGLYLYLKQDFLCSWQSLCICQNESDKNRHIAELIRLLGEFRSNKCFNCGTAL